MVPRGGRRTNRRMSRYRGRTLLRRRDLQLGFDSFFDRQGPLVLEIGFGDGRFLVESARQSPEWNLLGVEISSRAYRRMHRERVWHARLFRGHGQMLLRDVIPPGSLHRIYVNFPDPWPRSRNQSRRLLQPKFFRMAANRLIDGGDLLLTTDHAEYFQFARDSARESGVFTEELLPPPPETLRTKYALKWQDQERAIYHVVFRPTAPGQAPQPLIIPETMQHALMEGSLSNLKQFEKHIRQFDGGTVVVSEAFRSLSAEGVLFKVIVEEADLHQELLVKAWHKADGVFVGLDPFGDPLGTRGCREAVRAVTKVLEESGLTMKSSWI